MPLRPVHRLDEPARLSLSMVASPRCRFRFARQNHCSAPQTAANFRILRARVPARTIFGSYSALGRFSTHRRSGTGQTTGSVPRFRAR